MTEDNLEKKEEKKIKEIETKRFTKNKYQMPKSVAIITILIILVLLLIFKVIPDISAPNYKEVPCYYWEEGNIKLYGIMKAEYTSIFVLRDTSNYSNFMIIDKRNESNEKEIPECEI